MLSVIGMVGLGRMGGNMVRRLAKSGIHCVAFDVNAKMVDALAAEGSTPAYTYEELAQKLQERAQATGHPRVVWVMVPSSVVNQTIADVAAHLGSGDVVIDGGNSFYRNGN